METRYRLIRRGIRGGVFYAVDALRRQRSNPSAASAEEAKRLINAKNEALRQPVLNLQIAKACRAGADANFVKRTWSETMAEFVKTKTGGPKTGSNRFRSERAVADMAFDAIRDLQLLDTRAERRVLVRYVGWGGLPQVFDAWNEEWKQERERLEALLTEDELDSARARPWANWPACKCSTWSCRRPTGGRWS